MSMIAPFTGTPPAGDAVPGIVQDICRTVGDVHRDLVTRISRDALDPIRNAAAAAASAHAGILERSGLVDPAAPPALPGRAIARYRAAVAARVLAPLLDVLDDIEPGTVTGAAWEEARARFREIIEHTPEALVGPEPAGLFGSRPEDPATLRWRKAAVRLIRAARSFAADLADATRHGLGRPVPDREEAHFQRVALRTLVAAHIDARLPPLQATLVETLATHLAGVAATLHGAVDAWFDAVLDAEVATDRPALHRVDDEAVAPAPPDAATHLDAVRGAAEHLHSALETIAATAGAEPAAATPLETIVIAEDALIADVEVAGSALAHVRPSATRGERTLRGLDRRLDLWAGWHRRTRAALRASMAVLEVRAASHALLGGVNADVADAARALAARLGATARTLRAERTELALAWDAAGPDLAADLPRAIAGAAERLPGIVEEDALEPLREAGPHHALQAAVDDRVGTLQAMIAELPEELVVQSRDSVAAPPAPDSGERRARPRALLSEAFDVVRLERLRGAADEVARAFAAAVDEAAQAPGIIEHNLRAAATELARAGGNAAAAHDAREHALGGIDRAAEILERLAAESTARVRPFSETACDTLHGAWTSILRRVRAGDAEPAPGPDMADVLRAGLRAGTARVAAVARDAAGIGRGLAGDGARADESMATSGALRKPARLGDEGGRATRAALVAADRVADALPPVYGRLFACRAVAERLALDARAAQLDIVRRHLEERTAGLTEALAITGWGGAGMAGFFDAALGALDGDGETVRRVSLGARPADEAALAAILAAALLPDAEPPGSLDGLAERILDDAAQEWPVVGLENLELLLLRTSSDNGLLGPLLEFLAATDSRVPWVVGAARPAWDCIERLEPLAAGLVRHLPLPPPSRTDLEGIIVGCHERSGLPLRFQEPDPVPGGMRRRLARAGDEAQRQAVLRTAFFDRLATAASPSLDLALFCWLRAARMDGVDGGLVVRFLEPLDFSFLGRLDFDQAVTLRAFLQHGALSIEEHDRVLAAPRPDSRRMFSSLAKLQLIEPAQPGAAPADRHARDAASWRLRPLVQGPVLNMLRARNLIG